MHLPGEKKKARQGCVLPLTPFWRNLNQRWNQCEVKGKTGESPKRAILVSKSLILGTRQSKVFGSKLLVLTPCRTVPVHGWGDDGGWGGGGQWIILLLTFACHAPQSWALVGQGCSHRSSKNSVSQFKCRLG